MTGSLYEKCAANLPVPLSQLDRYSSLDIKIPAVQRIDRPWVTDYLITSHSTGDPEHPLAVFVGSNECVELSS